ncbi:MAG: DUF2145 domain-containing protein [Rubrivivax sp.]|nr:DUF2145 domain-containing protein [Rubrivivax sp.]
MLRTTFTAVALAALLTTTAAHAGRSCEQRLPDASAVLRSIELAERTRQALDATGAEVVVLARAGQDLGRWGLQWSHLGLAYRDPFAGGAWRVVHKLNQCGSARADVYRQGLAEFFLDDLWQYRAALAPLSPAAQRKLMAVLDDNRRVTRLHAAAYSMVAYPWAQRYQQSNQWAIETIAMAHEPAAATRERAQAWLRLQGYEPSVLRIGAMTRLGARMTAANVAFDDHPNEKRFGDHIETVTVDSVFAWLERAALAGRVQVVR